jgi:hypothetical protein
MTSVWGQRIRRFLDVLARGGRFAASNVTYKHGPQVWDFFIAAVRNGPALVVVDGNPFAIDTKSLAEGVASAMQSGFSEPFVKFTADPAEAPNPAYRIIWTLDPAPGYDLNAVCGERRPPTAAPAGERFEMRVAFCQDGRLLSAVHGWMARASAGPDQAAWRNLIAQMTRQLIRNEGT